MTIRMSDKNIQSAQLYLKIRSICIVPDLELSARLPPTELLLGPSKIECLRNKTNTPYLSLEVILPWTPWQRDERIFFYKLSESILQLLLFQICLLEKYWQYYNDTRRIWIIPSGVINSELGAWNVLSPASSSAESLLYSSSQSVLFLDFRLKSIC